MEDPSTAANFEKNQLLVKDLDNTNIVSRHVVNDDEPTPQLLNRERTKIYNCISSAKKSKLGIASLKTKWSREVW